VRPGPRSVAAHVPGLTPTDLDKAADTLGLCEREDASKVATHGRTDDVNLVRAKRINEAGQPFDTETAKTGRPAAACRASLPICTVGRREAPAPRSITGARLVPIPSTDLVGDRP